MRTIPCAEKLIVLDVLDELEVRAVVRRTNTTVPVFTGTPSCKVRSETRRETELVLRQADNIALSQQVLQNLVRISADFPLPLHQPAVLRR